MSTRRPSCESWMLTAIWSPESMNRSVAAFGVNVAVVASNGLGGACGVLVGVVVTSGYALSQGWPAVLPLGALVGGVGVSVLAGAVAGVRTRR